MSKKVFKRIVPLAIVSCWLGCPGDPDVVLDSSTSSGDGPATVGDASPGDSGQAALEGGGASDAPAAADLGTTVQDHGVVTDSQHSNDQKGILDAHVNTCVADSDCTVFEDCCKCIGVPVVNTPSACKKTCTDQACTAVLGLSQPVAYCANSQCMVGDGTACSSDSDCKLVNDCCRCTALPVAIADPACDIPSCPVLACAVDGIPNAQAQCISGTCRIVP